MNEPSALSALSEFAASLDADQLPEPTLRIAKACLLYGLAVGIGTRRAQPALKAAAASRCDGDGDASTTRLIDGRRISRANAAFANAVLLSGRVQGDSHPCGHLGGVVIPSALAATEKAGGSGRALLSSIVAGYEVALRIGRDHAADLSTRGFRTTPCYGVFGAAAAAGRAQGFSPAQMTDALCLAVNFAAGLREYVDAGTEESPFQAGFAARNGLYVADLIAAGVQAAPSALTGNAGFYQAYGGLDGVAYDRRLADRLNDHYEFTAVTFKEYPACQFLRGIIYGLARLRKQASAGKPVRIELRMNPYEADFIGVRFSGPFRSAAQTVMSAPFCAALAWSSGTASFSGLRTFDNGDVNALIPLIRVISDPARERYEPMMTVTLANGESLEWREQAGDSNYRLTWEAAVEMTTQLCAEVDVPAPLALALIDRVAAVDDLADLAPLIDSVCAATLSP